MESLLTGWCGRGAVVERVQTAILTAAYHILKKRYVGSEILLRDVGRLPRYIYTLAAE